MKQALQAIGTEPMFLTPAELGSFVKAKSRKWGEIVRESGAKPG